MAARAYRFAIFDELRPVLARMQGPIGEWDDVVPGGVMLWPGMLVGVLAPDGRVFACDTFSDGPWYEVTAEHEACFLIVLGAEYRAAPELLGLLPLRPAGATICAGCSGTGHERGTGWVCFGCGSLGWVRVEAESVTAPAPVRPPGRRAESFGRRRRR